MVNAAPVAVTAMAWTTTLGDDVESVWRRLLAGGQGFEIVPSPFRLRNELAARAPSIDEDKPDARLHAMSRDTIARAAAGINTRDATLVIGTSFGSWVEKPETTSTWADRLGTELGFADVVSLSTACSSGSDAIAVAAALIRSGMAECCVCGGADILTSSKRLAHSALATMSPTMIRPFDRRHDGTLLGEGAAFLVLESPARAPDATIFLRGTGSANDAASMTTPDSESRGARLAMERSIADAHIDRRDIGVVNAHGSGTPINDRLERDALHAVFGEDGGPIVFGTKSSFGHTLGATGAIEAVAVIQSLRTGVVPPTAALEEPDPSFHLPLAIASPSSHQARFGLSVTLGFGGFDTSLIFEVLR